MDTFKPGQVISPQSSTPVPPPVEPSVPPGGAPEPERPVEQPEPAPQPTPAPEPAASSAPDPVSTAEPATPAPSETAGGWQFRREAEPAGLPGEPVAPPEDLSWTASEFIAHEKSTGWYGLFALGTVVVTALVYLVTRDKISTAVVLFGAATFGFFAGRKPRTQQYSLSGRGLQIGQKFYGFQDFKTFSITEEGAIASISFTPLKRFMPALTIYVAPDIEDRVVDFLSAYLPFEQSKSDAIDSLLRRLRF